MNLKYKITICLTVSLFLIPCRSFSQILNADAFGKRKQMGKALQGEIELGLDLDKEQEIILDFNNATDISYYFNNNLIILADHFELLKSGSQSFLNSGFVHLRFRRIAGEKIGPEFFLQYQWDAVRGLDNRALSGSNLRYRVKQDSLTAIYFGLGMMFEFERWSFAAVPVNKRPADTAAVDFQRVKLNSYLSISQQVTPDFFINFISYFQTKPDEDVLLPRISVSTELSFQISRRLSFNVGYSSFYDARPSVPIDKFYFSMGNKLSINF